ncbi:DUF1549 domain-containing protein [Phragmitibacter flavus]|uniref:DUF1549 domain-containing protein n=1 Tax=Phragmitibacter flavus TaxID=2576071 RepID=A0A5R8KA69_9BACT|nr:DUF1549 domain-containing protein [Phragmitibacter flavus]TLD69213.1 DUF1549 domain-containing protein [Phragmitibacter flavus]
MKTFLPYLSKGLRLLMVVAASAVALELSAQEKGGYANTKVVELKTPPAKVAGSTEEEPELKAVVAKIDELLMKKLVAEKVEPTARANDEVMVRRIYLDVIGRVPTKDEAVAFIDSKDPEKLAKLVDTLLASEGYVQNMFNFWADVLRVKTGIAPGGQGSSTGVAYIQWLKESLRSNKPYDQLVRELLTADGASYENGAIGYYMRDYNMALDNMAITTQVFMGTQMVCAQCHDHPFDKWTQMDYYQMAAHSYGMRGTAVLTGQEGVTRLMQREKVKPAERRELQQALGLIRFRLRFNHIAAFDRKLELPDDYQYDNGKPGQVISPLIPAALGPEGNIVEEGKAPIEAYAQWMTSRENPRFTLVVANRLWKKLFGMGVIDPVDELTDSTVPSNPELMAFLDKTMKDLNYDMKAYLRVLLNTDLYQREAYTKDVEPGEVYHFVGPVLRRMSAEQIWDSMVGLMRDNPDEPSAASYLETKQALTKIEWMDRLLEVQSPKEVLDGMRTIADYQKVLAAEVKAHLETLKTSKDEKEIRAARQAARRQRAKIYEKADEVVFNRGYQKLAKEIRTHGVDAVAAKTDEEFAKQIAFAVNKLDDDASMEEAQAAVLAEMSRPNRRLLETVREREMKEWSVGKDKEERQDYRLFADYRDKFAWRSADLRNPAPNGHFLRQYGQSDRELVDNSNREGSVMQALTMMNGPLFRSLMNPYSKLSRDMKGDASNEEMIDTIYLSTLSRRATAEEKSILGEVMASSGKKGRGDVLWSVLNTRQFLFIQ